MDEILKYLKLYNERHPEYRGMVGFSLMDDGSGQLVDINDEYIRGTKFVNLDEFKRVCEES